MGRKPLAGTRKSGRLVVLLTDKERKSLDWAAKIAGKPVSTWVRDQVLYAAGEMPRGKKKRGGS